MKHFNTPIKLSVSLAALLLSQASFAGGTDAGTVVENTATISYSVGGAPQAPISSLVADFKVDQKVDLTVTGNSGVNIIVSPSSPRATPVNKLTYVLNNEGNSPQDFKINVTHLGSDDFDAGTGSTASPLAPEACQFTIDTGTGPGPATAISSAGSVSLAKDATAEIVVMCSMPNRPDVDDGHLSTIDVLATAVDSGGATMAESTIADREDEVDVVLADDFRTTSTTDTADRNAMHSDTQTFEINAPMLEVIKTSAVISDPFNSTNPKRIPGAVVEYTITIKNTSDAPATGLTVTDVLTDPAIGQAVEFLTTSPIVNASGTAQSFTNATKTIEATGITVPAASGGTPGEAVVTFQVTIL